jgi:hypothetical protein
MAKSRPPSTIGEYRRIAHAFLVGCKLPAGSKAYVVMSTDPPLYRVQGIYGSLVEADTALKALELPGFAWTKGERDAREIIECVVPNMSDANQLKVRDEGYSTESQIRLPDNQSAVPPGDLTFENIEQVQLNLTVKGTVVTYTFPECTTAIFLTQGAADAFLFSQYHAYFGHDYEVERRKRG